MGVSHPKMSTVVDTIYIDWYNSLGVSHPKMSTVVDAISTTCWITEFYVKHLSKKQIEIMIRAVCFNKKSFSPHVLKRICEETKGIMGGCLIDPALVNCIESFPDGNIYLSYVSSNIPKNVYNCKDDINRFIQANKNFGGIMK